MSATRNRHAFTLVELLVVIGIIALLISVLLPSLARARQTANLIACSSNLRQLYNGCLFYGQDNKGLLPFVAVDWNGGQMAISYVLTRYAGKDVPADSEFENWNAFNTSTISPLFRCMERPYFEGWWNDGWSRTISFHPRSFPGSDQWNNVDYPQYKLTRCQDSANKALFWEGAQYKDWNSCTLPSNILLDGWRWNWSHRYIWPVDPTDTGTLSRLENAVDMSGCQNIDPAGGWDWSGPAIRYRHLNNTTTPVCFFDGHVESRKLGEIKVREILITR